VLLTGIKIVLLMNIGVLYPRSSAHPGISLDFIESIKLCLKQQGLQDNMHFYSESVGLGGSEKEVYEKAEKLLVIDGVDVLVAYIDLKVTDLLEPLLYSSGKLMIVVNPGANYPVNWVPQPNILYLTLQHSFLCWLTGKEAAADKNAIAAVATTFYDCGYLHMASITKGFMRNGGSVTYNYVNNQRYDDKFEVNQLTDFLSSNPSTNHLLCVMDSLPAELFYRQLNTYSAASTLQLYVSPMMLDEKVLRGLLAELSYTIDGYAPWMVQLPGEANQHFVDYYFQQTKRAPSVFSLLGWETGMVLEQVFIHGSDHLADGAALVKILSGKKIQSPRGELQLDEQTNYFLAPLYKCSTRTDRSRLGIEPAGYQATEWSAFIKEPTEGLVSGWTNTYLCY
jgi:branched-chain amino acid transport system substrate-binding protein